MVDGVSYISVGQEGKGRKVCQLCSPCERCDTVFI